MRRLHTPPVCDEYGRVTGTWIDGQRYDIDQTYDAQSWATIPVIE